MGPDRGKNWIYLYSCTCKKSSGLETTTVFPLAWATSFQKRAKDKGTFVHINCGRLQSCFPCVRLELRWADYPQISFYLVSEDIKSLLKRLQGLWSVFCAESWPCGVAAQQEGERKPLCLAQHMLWPVCLAVLLLLILENTPLADFCQMTFVLAELFLSL